MKYRQTVNYNAPIANGHFRSHNLVKYRLSLSGEFDDIKERLHVLSTFPRAPLLSSSAPPPVSLCSRVPIALIFLLHLSLHSFYFFPLCYSIISVSLGPPLSIVTPSVSFSCPYPPISYSPVGSYELPKTFLLLGCYGKNFGPKGFGYGQGAGALTLTK